MKFTFFSLATGLFFGAVTPAFPADVEIPKLAEIAVSNQSIAPLILRFQADSESIKHTHDITAGPKREAALRSLYSGWLAAIAAINYQKLSLEDQIDYALFKRELQYQLTQLSFERQRFVQVMPLMPKLDSLIELAEARRELVYADAKTTAQVLTLAKQELSKKHAQLEKRDAKTAPSAIDAFRAAKYVRGVQGDLKEWFNFYHGYDPSFSYWNKTAYDALDKAMTEYANFLRDKIAPPKAWPHRSGPCRPTPLARVRAWEADRRGTRTC